ncbi:MAG: alginate lyase family protein [Bacteroidales bacterium]|nr:alginate lyase family protein [Bacteroidales bacterium]
MKKVLIFCLSAISALACSTKENYETVVGDPDLELIPGTTSGDPSEINADVFELIDLEYPGLENVKYFYDAGDIASAAAELLNYYRTRSVINPFVSMLAAPYTSSAAISIADQATKEGGYRFKVSDYVDADGLGYSFLAEDGSINWDIPEAMQGESQFESQLHRHQWMLTQAKVYKSTGDEKYVRAWIEVYFDWVKEFPCGEGKTYDLPWWGLQPAVRAHDQMSIFSYYVGAEAFTPAVLSEFLLSFHTHIKNITLNWYEEAGSNVRLSQEKTVYMAGVLMPEFKDASEWYKAGCDGMAAQINNQFHEDGVHNEFDPGYHIGAIADFYDIYKLAQLNGLLSDFPSDFIESLRGTVNFVKDIMYPDYSVEIIGDTHADSWNKSVLTKNFRKYAEMFPDDKGLQWIAYEGASGVKPISTFASYPVSGYYMMRSGWDRESIMLIHKNSNDPQKWFHNQSDNGHVSLYVNGRHFLPDAGFYTYNEGATRNAYRETSMHNTITKEGFNLIDKRAGKHLKSETASEYELVVTENESYADLTHRRAIFFVAKKFYVLVDEAYGTNEGKVNLNFNLWGGAGDGPGNSQSGKDVTIIDEYAGKTYCGAHSTFSDGNNLLLRTFSETSDDFKCTYNTRYFSNAVNERTQRWWYEASVTKKADKAARFITVILPFGNAAEFDSQEVSAIFIDNPDPENAGTFHGNGGAAVKVSINGTDYSLSYNLN